MDLPTLLKSLFLIVALIINFLLAFMVYKNNPKSVTNIAFALLCWFTSAWLVVNYVSLIPDVWQGNLFWIRLSIFFGTIQIFLFFLLANTLPRERIVLRNRFFYPVIAITAIVSSLTLSPHVFTAIEVVNGSPNPIPGWGMIFFASYAVIFSLGSVVVLLKRVKQSMGTEKQQVRFVAFGSISLLGLTFFTVLIPVVLFKNNFFVSLAPIYTLIFLGMTTYAIIRHRLLDIRLVVARTVSYTVLVGILAAVYSLIFQALAITLSNSTVDIKTIALSTLLTLITALSFQTVRRNLEKVTDKFLYKDHYDTSKLLYNLALILASTFRLEDLTNQVLKELLSQIKISRGAFILIEKDKIFQIAHQGYTTTNPMSNASQILALINIHHMLIFENLQEGRIKEILRILYATIIIPLHAEGEDIGLLVLGEKLSGDIYTDEDIRVLETFANEAAVAIQNSKASEEIRRFNITLQEEVKQATRDLRVANVKLQELDKLKDDFVSVASHELRTPMTAIRSYTWMALYRSDVPLTEKLKKYLSRTLTSTERLINLVNDMLNVSRIESGRIEINPQAFDISKLVQDVVAEVESKATEKNIRLEIDKTNVPQTFADPDKVHQVLLNLVGNSLKFTPNDGKIFISFYSDGNFTEISVKDSGVGVNKEDIPRLFQKFGRLDYSYVAAATSGGTGLGLYISKSLIELMKGRIWARSEGLNKGATFTFSLPVATRENLEQSEKFRLRPRGEAKGLEPVAI